MKTLLTLLLLTFLHATAHAQLNLLDALKKQPAVTNALPSLASLTEDQTAKALKEALAKGTERAVKQLGTNGGFLTNLNVKIPLPASLQKVDQTLRKLKQEALAEEFVTTMNRAAEKPAFTNRKCTLGRQVINRAPHRRARPSPCGPFSWP